MRYVLLTYLLTCHRPVYQLAGFDQVTEGLSYVFCIYTQCTVQLLYKYDMLVLSASRPHYSEATLSLLQLIRDVVGCRRKTS